MGRPIRIEFPGALYHVVSRGNERQRIFRDRKDNESFLDLLQESHERQGTLIHSYVLMGNHYHLVLETPLGNLSQVMHSTNSAYTKHFNSRHKRVGHLFQGRYRAVLVEKESYLLELSRYVHLNPVRAKIVKKPEEYRWSSYPSFVGLALEKNFVEYGWILSRFGERRSQAGRRYRRFVESGIDKEKWDFLEEVVAGVILGREPFAARVKGMISGEKLDREIVQRHRLRRWVEPSIVIEKVAQACGVSPEEVKKKAGRGNLPRKVAITLVRKYCGLGNEEVGRLFGGLSGSAVSRTISRLEEEATENRELNRLLQRLVSNVKA